MKIFTAEYSSTLFNILHVHVNDTSEEVVLEVDYMADDQTLEDFKEFKVDQAGRVLRYRVLVKD